MVFPKIMKDKRGFSFVNLAFAVIAFSVIIIAAGTILTEWNTTYNTDAANDLGEFNKLTQVRGVADNQSGIITSSNSEGGQTSTLTDTFESKTFLGVFGIIPKLFSSYQFVMGDEGLIESLATRYGLPSWIDEALTTFFLVAMVGAIVALIFRVQGGKI